MWLSQFYQSSFIPPLISLDSLKLSLTEFVFKLPSHHYLLGMWHAPPHFWHLYITFTAASQIRKLFLILPTVLISTPHRGHIGSSSKISIAGLPPHCLDPPEVFCCWSFQSLVPLYPGVFYSNCLWYCYFLVIINSVGGTVLHVPSIYCRRVWCCGDLFKLRPACQVVESHWFNHHLRIKTLSQCPGLEL